MSHDLSQQQRSLNRRRFLMLSGVGLFGVLGCSGGKGSGGGGSNTPLPAILQPNAVLLPNDGTIRVAGRTENTITLSGSLPALKAGQVLLGTMGEGFMLRVLSSTPDGTGGVVVQTEQASLEDVFQQVDFRLPEEYDPADFVDTNPEDTDVEFVRPGRSRLEDTSREFKIVVHKAVLAGTKDNGIVCEGSITFKYKADFQLLVKEGRTQYHRYVPTLEVKSGCKVVVTQKFPGVPGRVKIKTLQGKTLYFYVIIAGIPVPIPYTPFLDIYLNRDGKFEVGFESPQSLITLKAGFEFTPATGTVPLSDYKIAMDPLSFNQLAAFKCAVGPGADFALRLLGVAGPYVKVDAYLDMELKKQSLPAGYNLKVGIGAKATVGTSVVVGDTTFIQREFPDLVEVRQNMYDKFYPSDEDDSHGCKTSGQRYGDVCGPTEWHRWDCETGECVFLAPK